MVVELSISFIERVYSLLKVNGICSFVLFLLLLLILFILTTSILRIEEQVDLFVQQ